MAATAIRRKPCRTKSAGGSGGARRSRIDVRFRGGLQGAATGRQGLDEAISLYVGGITLRDSDFHLEHTLGVQLGHDTIFKITVGIPSL